MYTKLKTTMYAGPKLKVLKHKFAFFNDLMTDNRLFVLFRLTSGDRIFINKYDTADLVTVNRMFNSAIPQKHCS